MGKLAITSFWILVAFFVSKVSTQQVGNDCSTADICIGALNEECDGSVCICSTGHEINNGICQAVDCLALTAPTNGHNLIYSSGTVYESVAIYSCVTGYVITGVSQRTCQADATWSDTDPTCTKVDCGTVTVPTNGAINNQLTTYLEEVTFTCSSGYTLTSAATITCQASGAWSDPFVTCSIVDCGTLTAPTHGGISVPGTTFGEIVTFSCEDGYDVTGSVTTECLASGLWSNSNPTCIIKDCGQLTQPTAGTVNYLTAVTTFNAQAQFSCNTGYNLIGTALTVCERTGAWSSGTPTCSITDCGGLGILTNGDISLSGGTTYGSQASFTCDTGYTLNGDTVSTCQAGGSWDNSVPTCDIKHCAALTDPVNGDTTYSAGTTPYGTVATFTCDTGYNLLGSATATCGSDAAWTDNVPFCQIVDCGTLTAPTDGTLALSSGTTYNSNAVFSCDLGHTMNGNSRVTCQEDGAWSGSVPFCNRNDCGSLTQPTNGAIYSQTGTAYESTATFSCDTGYALVGSGSLTCQSDGSWSALEPVCNIKDCGTVAVPTDGTISSTTGTTFLATIVFACNTGYNMFGSSTIICQDDGAWTGSTPICLIKDCDTLSTPVNGYMNLTSGTTYGSVASFYCVTGYTRVGSSELNCIASGSWDPSSEPTCQIVDCGALTAPTNGGMSNPEATTYLTSVTFNCDTGYDLVGSAAIVCQSDATWNDTEAICNIKDCGTLAPPSNGNVVTTDTTYGETGTFSCYTGYTIVGVTTRTCQADGSWSSSSPFCQIIDCGVLPQPSNGNLTTPGGTTFGGIAVYQCNLGYTLMGDNIRTCHADTTWSTSAPVCQINGCQALTAPTNGSLVYSAGTAYNSNAIFSCNLGYTMNGNSQLTCQDNGVWNGSKPYCNINDCGALTAKPNGAIISQTGTVYQSTATFSCDIGYNMVGSGSLTCQSHGSWSASEPNCTITDCGYVAAPTGGSISSTTGTTYLSTVLFACNMGYDMVGVSTILCKDDGTWNGNTPICLIRDGHSVCPVQEDPYTKFCPRHEDGRGTIWPETKSGLWIVINCSVDYIGTVSRNCSLQGQWKPPLYSCVRQEFAQASQEINDILENPTEDGVQSALETLTNVTMPGNRLYEGEIQEVVSFLNRIVNVNTTEVVVTRTQTESFFSTTDNLLDKTNENAWKSISQNSDEEETSGVVEVLQTIGSYVETVANSLTEEDPNRTISGKNMELVIAKVQTSTDLRFPLNSIETQNQSNLFLPRESLIANRSYQDQTAPTGSLSYSAVIYKDLSGIIDGPSVSTYSEGKEMNSAVLAVTLFPGNQHNLQQPLVLTFRHLKMDYINPKCTFWNFKRNGWDTEGCTLENTTIDVSACKCDHLTNFALLMSPWVRTNEQSIAIGIISYAGCSLSALCLLITVAVHIFLWRYIKADRVVILINLSMALAVSYIIFLVGVRQTDNEDACTAIAVMLQYIYLVVFFLMLSEGIEIAVTVLYVFPTKSRLKWILPLAWGLPAVIVGVSIGVTKLEGYGTDDFCWLSVDNHLIWWFVGPALLIIAVNFVLLILVMRTMFNTRTLSQASNKTKAMAGIRCMCVLLPLMGCSWILGVFYVSEDAAWIQYVFALCNSLQGVVIFICHCLTNKKIRDAIKRRNRKYNDSLPTLPRTSPTGVSEPLDNSGELRNYTSDVNTRDINEEHGRVDKLHIGELRNYTSDVNTRDINEEHGRVDKLHIGELRNYTSVVSTRDINEEHGRVDTLHIGELRNYTSDVSTRDINEEHGRFDTLHIAEVQQ